jgi:predicted transcriptional regulator
MVLKMPAPEDERMDIVADVMQPRVLVVSPGDRVAYVREVMLGQRIHAVPVFDDEDRAIGIITATDLIDAPHGDIEVADLMTRDVVTVARDEPVAEAARLMRANRLHHLLVTQDGEVVGILSSFDLLRVVEESAHRARSSGN